MKGLVAAAAAAACLLGLPAIAQAAEPPPGSAMSTNLEYLARVPDAAGITEGKFDRVRGTDVMVITGRFGFKTYDVSDPADPEPLDAYLPPELAANGYWQNEDMELDTRRKLIIGALDPRHNELAPTDCTGANSDKIANPKCKSGFYVISYADPANLRQVGDFVAMPSGHTSSCIQDCRYIWTGGPARTNNPALAWLGPIYASGSGDEPARRRRPADLGHRPAQPERPEGVRRARRPVAQRRLHRLLARRRRGRPGHRLGQRPRRRPRLRHERPAPRPVPEPGPPGDAVRPDPRRRRRRRRDRAARDADAQLGPPDRRVRQGLRDQEGQRPGRDGGGLHDAVRDERQDRPLRPHRLVGRRARAALDARAAVPDEGAGHVPPVHRHAGDREPGRRLLGALLRDRGADARRRLVRPGPAPDRHLGRAPRAAGRLLPRDRHRHGQPVLELVGHGVPQRPQARATSSTCST